MASDGNDGTVAGFDPAAILLQIVTATAALLDEAAAYTDADVRAPSLRPDWSRGHVLTHLARNADGGRRLLAWARTGVAAAEYPSMAARAEEIDAGAGRGAADLLVDLRGSCERFEQEYRLMPPDAWSRIVRWTGGAEHPAVRVADSRLGEVLIHHIDLDAGYTPAQWPDDFVRDLLPRVAEALGRRDDAPAVRIESTDGVAAYTIGAGECVPVVSGTRSSLPAWLVGRSQGADLKVDGAARPPVVPALY